MKVLTWITALVLVVPTVGISLAVAIVVTMYINKQERLAAAQIVLSAASSLKIEIVNKYYRLRSQEGLSSTQRTDSDILENVMKICSIIEGVLEESGRFHKDKDDVIQLAVRITSYAEDFNLDEFTKTINEQLSFVNQVGVTAALRMPYKTQKACLGFDDDDDVHF